MMLRLLFYGPRRVKCLVFYAAACAMLFPRGVGGVYCVSESETVALPKQKLIHMPLILGI